MVQGFILNDVVAVLCFIGVLKKQQNNIFSTKLHFYLASHKKQLYTLVIGCRSVIAKGKPSTRRLRFHLSSPTCPGCLLHPPPLVDLTRDRKISGFFLVFFLQEYVLLHFFSAITARSYKYIG